MDFTPPTTGQAGAAFSGPDTGALPLFHAAWLFAAGIALTQGFWLPPALLLVTLIAVAMLASVAALRAQRVAWLPLVLLWLLLGAWCAEMEPHPAPAPELAALSDGLLRTVEGTVVNAGPMRSASNPGVIDRADMDAPAEHAGQKTQLIDLRVSSLEVVTDREDAQVPVAGGVRLAVRWPENPSREAAPQPFRCGQRIRAAVRLLPPEVYHDPGVWSRADYLLDQGITSTAAVNIESVDPAGQSAGLFFFCRLRELQHAASARLLALPAAMRSLPAPLRLSNDDAVMLAAMATGDRTYLSHTLRVGFERTGSFHMLVVSGLHMAIVAGFLFWIARLLRLPRVPATLLTILASLAYALFTGFATPVERSLWMITLYLLGRLIYRERHPLNTIGFAALCLLAWSPRSLFDASFQMTLLAVVSIAGIAAPLLESTIHPYLTATRNLRLIALDVKLPAKIAQFRLILRMMAAGFEQSIHPARHSGREPSAETGDPQASDAVLPQFALFGAAPQIFSFGFRAATRRRIARFLAWRFFPGSVRFLLRVVELVVVSCVVELTMAQPMALYFHRITIFALPVNIFILPLLLILMPAALVTLLMALVWPPFAVAPAAVAAVFLHIGVGLVQRFGSMALGDFRIPAPLVWQSLAFCALLGVAMILAHLAIAFARNKPRRSTPVALASLAVLLAAAVTAVLPRPVDHPHNALLMEAIDVGQGDSLLLITPGGKTLLVDGGGFGGGQRYTPQNFDIGEDVVSEVLWSRGIRHLDAVALTHGHSDHMGGLPAVLRNFHPDQFWIGNNPHFPAYDALLAEAASLHVRLRPLRAGDAFPFGGTRVTVLAPFRDYRPGPEPTNDDSLVLRVAYGATSVLLEGDAEAPIEQRMLSEPGLASTLLKVGHHGSNTSTRPAFLSRVAPQWAVISCGLHNRYGHPRIEVLQALEAARVRTFSTDINGATCFFLNGRTTVPDLACGWRPGL
ncbi:MAG: ComEC/Rec2 family competence protein [Terracidiphilus sp.]